MRLTFVTGNPGKLREVAAQLEPLGHTLVQDTRGYPEIQAKTLAEVTDAGATQLLASGLRPPFLLEDSGLFVSALRGFPGVYSRHALETIGLDGLLRLMAPIELEMRGAAFETDLLYVDANGTRHHLQGLCKGTLAQRPAGLGGFGFDPIFIPTGPGCDGRTFAQMSAAEKATVGHRGAAVRALIGLLDKTAKA